MNPLSTQQIIFLDQYKIPRSKVFDATGMKKSSYGKLMSALGMTVAFGVTPCREEGHELRTRPGHCAICRPDRLAYQARFGDPGEVYVAYSKKLSLVKIGTTGDTLDRMKNINYYGYGGAKDWILKYSKHVQNAGRIEWQAQKGVEHSQVWRTYIKDGFSVDCQELFDCDVATAIQSIKDSIASPKNS